MISKTIYQEVAIDVNLDLSDFDNDELIEEVEDRGLIVLDQEDSGAMSNAAKDEVYELYRDYISGNNFEQNLKKFFEGQLGFIVH